MVCVFGSVLINSIAYSIDCVFTFDSFVMISVFLRHRFELVLVLVLVFNFVFIFDVFVVDCRVIDMNEINNN